LILKNITSCLRYTYLVFIAKLLVIVDHGEAVCLMFYVSYMYVSGEVCMRRTLKQYCIAANFLLATLQKFYRNARCFACHKLHLVSIHVSFSRSNKHFVLIIICHLSMLLPYSFSAFSCNCFLFSCIMRMPWSNCHVPCGCSCIATQTIF